MNFCLSPYGNLPENGRRRTFGWPVVRGWFSLISCRRETHATCETAFCLPSRRCKWKRRRWNGSIWSSPVCPFYPSAKPSGILKGCRIEVRYLLEKTVILYRWRHSNRASACEKARIAWVRNIPIPNAWKLGWDSPWLGRQECQHLRSRHNHNSRPPRCQMRPVCAERMNRCFIQFAIASSIWPNVQCNQMLLLAIWFLKNTYVAILGTSLAGNPLRK